MKIFEAIVDNSQFQQKKLRAMNFPLYLVYSNLKERGKITKDEISKIDGIDTTKTTVNKLVEQLEKIGLAVNRDGIIVLLDRDE